MIDEQVKNAIRLANDFVARAKEALNDRNEFEHEGKIVSYMRPGKKSGACRRASMDLTRALAEMRRP